MPSLRSNKRGRSMDQHTMGKTQQRLITAGDQVEPDEAKSDSEYDSVGKGRKCLRVSRTPLHHTPSSMRIMLHNASIEPVSNATAPAPGLLEWHPIPDPVLCMHDGEIQELTTEIRESKAQVGHLGVEAQRNIELRAEIY
jgi:hypothetical protein